MKKLKSNENVTLFFNDIPLTADDHFCGLRGQSVFEL